MKNLTIFRSEKGWKPNFELLNGNLLVPGKLGYAWKVLRDNNPFITVAENHLITCEKQEKLIPNQVVEKELRARIDQIEETQGYKVGKKQKRDLKEQIIEALYVKAFTVSKLVNVWINTEHDLLCIETTSTNVADSVVVQLIRDLEWRGHKLITNRSVVSFLRFLVPDDENHHTGNFSLGKGLVLEGHGGKITYSNENLNDLSVIGYVTNADKLPVKAELELFDTCRFTINDRLVISKITLPDITIDSAECDTVNDYFDAEFTIRAGQCITLINELIAVLGEKGSEQ